MQKTLIEPKHRKTFRDKYLAVKKGVAALIISVFISVFAFGQNVHNVPAGKPSTSNVGEHYKTVINLRDYGIIPDCNGTSGNGTDWTTQFRAAVADCNPNGCKILLPTPASGSSGKGIRITDSISFAGRNVEMEGFGKSPLLIYQLTDAPSNAGTNIFFDHGTRNCFTVDSTSTNKYPIVYFHDFNIKNISSTPPTSGAGIVVRNNNQGSQIVSVSVQRFHVDIDLVSANLIRVTHCDFEFPVLYGAKVGNNRAQDFGGVYFDFVNIVADTLPTSVAIGLYYTGGGAFSMDHSSISGQAGTDNSHFINDIYTDYSGGATTDFRVSNTFLELFQHQVILMRNRTGTAQPALVGNIQFTNIEIFAYNTNTTPYSAIDISNFFNVTFDGIVAGSGVGAVAHPLIALDSITNAVIGGVITYKDYNSLYSTTASCVNVQSVVTSVGGTDNGQIQPGKYSLTNYALRVSDLNFQGALANDMFIVDNAKYSSGWTRTNTGFVEGFNYYIGQIGFIANNTGASGAFTPKFPMKVDHANSGSVYLGGDIDMTAAGVSTGASMWVTGSNIFASSTKIPTGTTTDSIIVATTDASVIGGRLTFKKVAQSSIGGSSSLTATYVGYGNGSNALTGTSDLTYTTSTGSFLVSKSQNATTFIQAVNATSNTAANVAIQASNGTQLVQLVTASAGYTPYGALVASSAGVYSNATHMPIIDDNAFGNIDFAIGAASTKDYIMDNTALYPAVAATYDLGTASLYWRDIYYSHPGSVTPIGATSTLGTNVTSLTPSGSDVDFELVLVSSGNVAGTIGNIAFGRTWGSRPHCIISAANSATGPSVFNGSGSYMALNAISTTQAQFTAVIIGAGTFTFNCHCGL